MSRRTASLVFIAVLLVAGVGFLTGWRSSGSLPSPDGPHMVYFHAQW